MRKYGGFTLIECMLYLFVLSIISVGWFSSAMRMYSTMRCIYVKNHILLTLYTAGDALVRDMRLKHPIHNEVFYPHNGVFWHYGQESRSVGWFLADHTLVRFEGIYNEGSDTWSDCTRSIVCNALISAQFTALKSHKAFLMSLNSHGIRMERTVWIE